MRLNEVYVQIKAHRERQSPAISQSVAAKAAGISLRQYQRIEKGEKEPTFEQIAKLASLFKVTPEVLLQAEVRDAGISNFNALQLKDMIKSVLSEVKTELLEPRIDDIKAEIIELLETTRKEDMHEILKILKQRRQKQPEE